MACLRRFTFRPHPLSTDCFPFIFLYNKNIFDCAVDHQHGVVHKWVQTIERWRWCTTSGCLAGRR